MLWVVLLITFADPLVCSPFRVMPEDALTGVPRQISLYFISGCHYESVARAGEISSPIFEPLCNNSTRRGKPGSSLGVPR